MQWDRSLETGDETVDAQHRELLGMFNDLQEKEVAGHGRDVMGDTLVRLSDYVATHFAAEEALMRRYGYSAENVEAHVAEHEELSRRTREMVLDYRQGRLASVVPLVEFLSDWLANHIRQVDRQMVDHVSTHGS